MLHFLKLVPVSILRLSPPLSSQLDVQNLAQSLAGNFMDVVQYNNDNKAFEVDIHRRVCVCVWVCVCM